MISTNVIESNTPFSKEKLCAIIRNSVVTEVKWEEGVSTIDTDAGVVAYTRNGSVTLTIKLHTDTMPTPKYFGSYTKLHTPDNGVRPSDVSRSTEEHDVLQNIDPTIDPREDGE